MLLRVVFVFQYEVECSSLRQLKDDLQQKSSDLEQRCHELTQKLKISQLAVNELEGASEQCTQLERQLQDATAHARETETRTNQLEEVLNVFVLYTVHTDTITLILMTQELSKLTVSLGERDGRIELLEVRQSVSWWMG